MISALDVIVQRDLSPRRSLATDRLLLDRTATGVGALRIHTVAGRTLALGRYHLAPDPPAGAPAIVWRRASGGRATPAGEGFFGLSLVLPHRAALVADDPLALDAAQVLNRCVRGILAACETARVPAIYPGRDTITVGGRVLGLVAFEVDAAGRCLVEAVLAGERSFAELPALLDAVDPEGVVAAAMLAPESTTSLAAELGRVPMLDELAEWMAGGYASRLGVRTVARALAPEELRAVDALADGAFADERWLGARRRRPDLDRRLSLAGQLGVVEAHLAIADDAIREIVLAGDLIANSPAVEKLEHALAGCPLERPEITRRVLRVLGRPGNFLLGLGSPAATADALARALAP